MSQVVQFCPQTLGVTRSRIAAVLRRELPALTFVDARRRDVS